jgi:hypothetical protein
MSYEPQSFNEFVAGRRAEIEHFQEKLDNTSRSNPGAWYPLAEHIECLEKSLETPEYLEREYDDYLKNIEREMRDLEDADEVTRREPEWDGGPFSCDDRDGPTTIVSDIDLQRMAVIGAYVSNRYLVEMRRSAGKERGFGIGTTEDNNARRFCAWFNECCKQYAREIHLPEYAGYFERDATQLLGLDDNDSDMDE